MTNLELYDNSFIEAFGVEQKQLDTLEYQSIPAWDSVGHMGLVAILEEKLDIMMDTDDIIDLSCYKKGKEILEKNYEIEF